MWKPQENDLETNGGGRRGNQLNANREPSLEAETDEKRFGKRGRTEWETNRVDTEPLGPNRKPAGGELETRAKLRN